MASINIDFSLESVNSSVSSNYVQYIPCNIDHNGEVNMKAFFKPYINETKEDEKEKGILPIFFSFWIVHLNYSFVLLKYSDFDTS